MIFLFLFLFCFSVTIGRPVDQLPHCSRSSVMEGGIRELDGKDGRTNIFSAVHFSMALNETACVTLKVNNESSVLHILEYVRLEQHHPISGKYTFGIPRITPSCICDCAGGESLCRMEQYNYKNCSSSPLCYATYHPVQSNIGCIGEQKSEACCKLKIEPYKDWTFTAIRISQPDTILVFSYRIYDRNNNNNQWRQYSEETIEVVMNKGSSKLHFNTQHKIELTVAGSRPNREVTPGMYFVRDGTNEVRSGVPINDIQTSDLGKLGWLKYKDGKWSVSNGPAKIKEKYHMDVHDCKAQIYSSTFNGEQVVISSSDEDQLNFHLGQPLSDDPWIRTAAVQDRVVRVEHAEGVTIMIHMITETRPNILKHTSQLGDFNGAMHLGDNSVRSLKLNFSRARGTIFGRIFTSETKKDQLDMALSIQIGDSDTRNHTSTISLPASIDGKRYICFHPSGDEEGELCKWINFEVEDLKTYSQAHTWQTGKGICERCNERGPEAIWAVLDPRSYMDGINSPKELIAFVFEATLVVVLILAVILVCTKCLIPLARCSLHVPRVSSKK
ncbi:unnamed protein product [Auanema sp. JU1783]|nr:unnamed protein product [Auanema sp. JU1783]